MAVPKKKKSRSRSNMRRGSNGSYAVKIPRVLINPTTGEFQLAHHISVDGYYKGRQVVEVNKASAEAEAAE